jgi:hypothetical protein
VERRARHNLVPVGKPIRPREEQTMIITKRLLTLLTAMLGCICMPSLADSDRHASFSALSAQWWQWAWSMPAGNDPVNDTTGASCMIGQRGPVWFLAGARSSEPVTRRCSIPEGVVLFFPVINSGFVYVPDCGDPNLSIAELRTLLAPFIDDASGLSVVLDGRPVKSLRRVRSDVFATVFPRRNVLGADCIVPGKVYSPSLDDGYYVKLPGLRAGTHRLRIRGTSGSFLVDVSYMLNVTKVTLRDPG